jgi:hypothetical protein
MSDGALSDSPTRIILLCFNLTLLRCFASWFPIRTYTFIAGVVAVIGSTGDALAGHRSFTTMSPYEEEGRPVTQQDISGKKFCWSKGGFAVYEANGDFTNAEGHNSNWWVTEPGVIKVGHTYRQTEVLPDGRIHQFWTKKQGRKEKDL